MEGKRSGDKVGIEELQTRTCLPALNNVVAEVTQKGLRRVIVENELQVPDKFRYNLTL